LIGVGGAVAAGSGKLEDSALPAAALVGYDGLPAPAAAAAGILVAL
jgi:hypothetical protein